MTFCIIFFKSFSAKGSNVKIRDLLTRALLTAKKGFSVVAPIKVIVPFSIEGNRASCWIDVNLWTSSINKIVFLFEFINLSFALAISFLNSLTLDNTAFNLINFDRVLKEIISIRVVFPTPGGPEKIKLLILSFIIALLKSEF